MGMSQETGRRVAIWVVSRLVISLVAIGGALAGGKDPDHTDRASWLLYRFAQFDSNLYAAIAERGYVANGPASHYNAFFPGLPGIMRGWTILTGTDGRWGALLVVELAGLLAAVLLGKLGSEVSGSEKVGTLTTTLWACSPLTVFFSVVYTEAIFLCLWVGAWIVARRGAWAAAGTLAGFACVFRLNGLFLVAALVVLYVMQERLGRGVRLRATAGFLAVGPLFVLGWAIWLHGLTGQWDAWAAAQEQGWGRTFSWPWAGLARGVGELGSLSSWHELLARTFDLAALGVAAVTPIYYVMRRNWPVATLLGLSGVTVVFSSILDSGARYLLVLFPLYISAAEWLAPRPRARRIIITISSALALVNTFSWSQKYWIA